MTGAGEAGGPVDEAPATPDAFPPPDVAVPGAGLEPTGRSLRPGPVPAVSTRAFIGLDRVDVAWLLGLVLVAFLLRAASPIFPNVLGGGSSGSAPVAAWGLGFPYNGDGCVDGVPVGPGGSPQKHCGFVFDEVYFPVDAARDLHQPALDYFDPEPPLAKLLMAPPIAALGFGGWSWRLTCAIAGSLLVGVVYLIARRLRRERYFAVAAALLVLVDGLAFVESRTGVIDIIAVFFAVLLVYAFLLHWQARTRAQWRSTLYLMALLMGLAFGAKLTALAPAILIVSLLAVRLLEPAALRTFPGLRRIAGPRHGEGAMWRDAAGPRVLAHYAVAALLVGAVFVACYSRYNSIPHDQVYIFTACTEQGGLQGTASHQTVPVLHAGGLTLPNPATAIANVYGHMRASLGYHNIECRGHPYASHWYTWQVMSHPVLFYADYRSFTTAAGVSETGWITDMGNPVLWWLAIPALLFCVWRCTRGPQWWRAAVGVLLVASLGLMMLTFHAAESATTVRVHPSALFLVGFAGALLFGLAAVLGAVLSRRFVPALIVLGYLAAWLMWVLGNEQRVLFFYHMLGAVPYMALALAYTLSALRLARIRLGSREVSLAPVAHAVLVLAVAAFIFFYPVWTGAPLTTPDHDMRLWTDGWL